jgi:digeranylgeranylglycerophospholipid reductase
MTGGVPSHIPDFPLFKNNLLVVGDAARVTDSLTGAGIANALVSGRLAGQTAARMVKEGASGKDYADQFNKVKQKELKFYRNCRDIYLKLTDSDFISILKFTDDMFGEKDVTAINPFDVVKKIILAHPRLLKIGRHLIF